MRMVLAAIFFGFLFAPKVLAQDAGPVGYWKFVVVDEGQPLWLIHFEDQKGKLVGEATRLRGPASTIEDAHVKGGLLLFTVKFQQNGARLPFEGKLPPPGGKKILGSLGRGEEMFSVYLEPTTAKNAFELNRDFVARTPNDPLVPYVVVELADSAKAQKVSSKEVQDWCDVALKNATGHGPRWQTEVYFRLLKPLVNDYPDVAWSLGKKMEAGFEAKAPAVNRLGLQEILLGLARKANKPDEVKQIAANIEALEPKAFAEHVEASKDVAVEKYAGRKSKSKRAVLVELFTGAQCPPCVAADVAFDALEKTYPDTDVVLLEYHLHIPGPDVLTNPDSNARSQYYANAVEGTPCILFNGKVELQRGGPRARAAAVYKDYRTVLDKHLDEEAVPIKLTASAVRKGNKVNITAAVKDLAKPAETMRLRLALVEDWVRYRGGNGVSYYHRVVRALPGGAKGAALAKADSEVAQVVDLDELQKNLTKYLDNFNKSEDGPFPDAQRPMRLRQLHLVAFVQDDVNNEVLQAVDIAVKNE